MNITTGILKGREVVSLQKTPWMHPMGDRQRQALFNTLGDIKDMSVLDVYSGSGIIGVEALSRGAGSVVAIERNDRSYAFSQRAILAMLPAELKTKWHIHHMGAKKYAENTTDVFDIVIADPPYDKVRVDVLELLAGLSCNVVVFSLPGDYNEPDLESLGFELVKSSVYAGAKLVFYKKIV